MTDEQVKELKEYAQKADELGFEVVDLLMNKASSGHLVLTSLSFSLKHLTDAALEFDDQAEKEVALSAILKTVNIIMKGTLKAVTGAGIQDPEAFIATHMGATVIKKSGESDNHE